MARFGAPTPRLTMWDEQGVARATLCPLHPSLFFGMTFPTLDDDDSYDMGRGAGDDARADQARQRFAASARAGDQAAALSALPGGVR